MTIATTNPATGETSRIFEPLSGDEIEEKLKRAAAAFREFRIIPIPERAQMIRRAATSLERQAREFASLITLEMGKPIKAAVAEVQKCALVCNYYADHAIESLADEYVDTSATASFIRYEPLGAILAVMPWNFPFWQVFRFAAPALMAGNVALLKHASSVPQCALAIESVFTGAGFPSGVFQTLLVEASEVARLIADPRVAAATLTGSEGAGRSIASAAGKEIKKVVLELGGSDPFIVMPSADLDDAVETAVKARTVNSGQSCIAAKRFIVHSSIAEAFESKFVAAMERLVVGDPADEATEIGPLANPQIISDLEKQVEATVRAGAKLLTGGRRRGGKGNFYEPTVLSQIPEGSPAAREELFGPVASIFRVETIDDAIRIANQTNFGLGASVWTRQTEERNRFVDELESGQVFVNAMVASDPRLPFGGVKRSGFGRELGLAGIREFVNVKTVWIH